MEPTGNSRQVFSSQIANFGCQKLSLIPEKKKGMTAIGSNSHWF